MGLKILHSADWHLDSPFLGFREDQREQLRRAQRRIPDRMADLCLREGCQLVLLSGDIFDGPYSRDTAQLVYTALARCGVPVLISPGNHDHLAPGSPWVMEKWPENVHVFTGELTSVAYPELNCRVWGAGYRSMDCPGLLEGFRALGEEAYQLAVLHGDPMALKSPYCPVTAAQVRDSGLSYLALGHIHRSGSFRARNTLCGWPGAPMGRGYDETREKGVYIVEVRERAQIRFVPLDLPRFYDLEVDLSRQSLEESLPAPGENVFLRLKLSGFGGPTGRELEAWLESYANLELNDGREASRDLWEGAGEDTLEGIYLRLLREKRSEKDPETNECVELAARISRQLLEGREVLL